MVIDVGFELKIGKNSKNGRNYPIFQNVMQWFVLVNVSYVAYKYVFR